MRTFMTAIDEWELYIEERGDEQYTHTALREQQPLS
jgi:hypothetical protein